jgi:hypothetical protein
VTRQAGPDLTLLASTTPNLTVAGPTTVAPFRARKEPLIDDSASRSIRAILGLAVVNMVLVVAALLVGSEPLVR